MTARRGVLLATYWACTLSVAALASVFGALPFTGPVASLAGVFASAAVGLIGIACAPSLGGAHR